MDGLGSASGMGLRPISRRSYERIQRLETLGAESRPPPFRNSKTKKFKAGYFLRREHAKKHVTDLNNIPTKKVAGFPVSIGA